MKWNTTSPRPTKLKPRRNNITMPEGFLKAWTNSRFTLSDICVEFGLCMAEVRKIARLHELPQRPPQSMQTKSASKRLPTPEEITERAAKIRAGWTEEMRSSRWTGKREQRYVVPVIDTSDLSLG